jgi:hypothetical protein
VADWAAPMGPLFHRFPYHPRDGDVGQRLIAVS